jgi:hypothetical protein
MKMVRTMGSWILNVILMVTGISLIMLYRRRCYDNYYRGKVIESYNVGWEVIAWIRANTRETNAKKVHTG